MKNTFKIRLFLTAFVFVALTGGLSAEKQNQWRQIDNGLHIGYFNTSKKSLTGDSVITVIKIDPKIHELRLLSSSELKHSEIPADKWSEKYNLIAVINAGMYHLDFRTHVGFMKNYDHLNNSEITGKYKSVAAFNPKNKKDKPFQIYDLENTTVEKISEKYNSVIQNLRLIKKPGTNQWTRQKRIWSEAALGEDKDGNVLFIFSRSPYSMHDFNNILLALPINIVAAQHLEGGPEASLFFSHKGTVIKKMGSFETAFQEDDNNDHYWPLPNVIGLEVMKKQLIPHETL
jgi:hypothetical protein